MIAALWARAQAWLAAAGLVLGAIVAALVVGRGQGKREAQARAAAEEQKAREKGNAAAADAERAGAADRLRAGRF